MWRTAAGRRCAEAGVRAAAVRRHIAHACLPLAAAPPRSNPKCVIASAGMQADMETLHKMLHSRHVTYQFNHRKCVGVLLGAAACGCQRVKKRVCGRSWCWPLDAVLLPTCSGAVGCQCSPRCCARRPRHPRAMPPRCAAGPWAAPPWPSCYPIPCTTSASSRTTPSTCAPAWTSRVSGAHNRARTRVAAAPCARRGGPSPPPPPAAAAVAAPVHACPPCLGHRARCCVHVRCHWVVRAGWIRRAGQVRSGGWGRVPAPAPTGGEGGEAGCAACCVRHASWPAPACPRLPPALARQRHSLHSLNPPSPSAPPAAPVLCCAPRSGKELIQPVLDNQLKAASPLVLPPQVR